MMADSPALILFSGLAADESVFIAQKLEFSELIVPSWPTPESTDTLDSYCARLADELRPHGRAVIGGASFGGFIAMHVAKYVDPIAVLLIGSVPCPAELPPYVRFARPLRPLVGIIPVRFLRFCLQAFTTRILRRRFPHLGGLARQFCNADPTVMKWSIARILDWKEQPPIDCPVFQIHGARDRVLPARYTSPDSCIAGGGHVISLTHPAEVNEFIRKTLADLE